MIGRDEGKGCFEVEVEIDREVVRKEVVSMFFDGFNLDQ